MRKLTLFGMFVGLGMTAMAEVVIGPPPRDLPPEEPPVVVLTCNQKLDLHAGTLTSTGVTGNDFVHAMQLKIEELGCGTYGEWRSTHNGPVGNKGATKTK